MSTKKFPTDEGTIIFNEDEREQARDDKKNKEIEAVVKLFRPNSSSGKDSSGLPKGVSQPPIFSPENSNEATTSGVHESPQTEDQQMRDEVFKQADIDKKIILKEHSVENNWVLVLSEDTMSSLLDMYEEAIQKTRADCEKTKPLTIVRTIKGYEEQEVKHMKLIEALSSKLEDALRERDETRIDLIHSEQKLSSLKTIFENLKNKRCACSDKIDYECGFCQEHKELKSSMEEKK